MRNIVRPTEKFWRFPVRFQRQWRRHGRRRRRRRSIHRRCTTHSLSSCCRRRRSSYVRGVPHRTTLRRRTPAMWSCTLLRQLCWQRPPDMPQSYQDIAAPVQLNFWTIVPRREFVKTNSTCVRFLNMHTRTFFKHIYYACSAAYEQLSFFCIYGVIVSVFIFCHCLIKRLLNASASTAYTDSCDCFANYLSLIHISEPTRPY